MKGTSSKRANDTVRLDTVSIPDVFAELRFKRPEEVQERSVHNPIYPAIFYKHMRGVQEMHRGGSPEVICGQKRRKTAGEDREISAQRIRWEGGERSMLQELVRRPYRFALASTESISTQWWCVRSGFILFPL